MTAANFGRKGVSAAEAAPVRRRAAFLVPPEQRRIPLEENDLDARIDAFLDEERARESQENERLARVEAALAEFIAEAEPLKPPTDRSLWIAWPVWFLLGLAGGHRFYLRRPITGAIQGAIFIACIGAVAWGYYPAFAGLALSWLWYLIDGLRMKRLFLTAGRP